MIEFFEEILRNIKNKTEVYLYVNDYYKTFESLVSIINLLRKYNIDVRFIEGNNIIGYPLFKFKNLENFFYYNIPEEYQLEAFFYLIKLSADGLDNKYDNKIVEVTRNINKKINIKLFITNNCPFSPDLVKILGDLAYLNKNIKIEVINYYLFKDIAERYNVRVTPLFIFESESKIVESYDFLDIEEIIAKLKTL